MDPIRTMTIYEYGKHPISGITTYEWKDRKGNILKVPDPSWDPAIDNENGRKLKEYLSLQGYEGPGDWNPA